MKNTNRHCQNQKIHQQVKCTHIILVLELVSKTVVGFLHYINFFTIENCGWYAVYNVNKTGMICRFLNYLVESSTKERTKMCTPVVRVVKITD